MLATTPHAMSLDALVLRVAYAYDALPYDQFERLQSSLSAPPRAWPSGW